MLRIGNVNIRNTLNLPYNADGAIHVGKFKVHSFIGKMVNDEYTIGYASGYAPTNPVFSDKKVIQTYFAERTGSASDYVNGMDANLYQYSTVLKKSTVPFNLPFAVGFRAEGDSKTGKNAEIFEEIYGSSTGYIHSYRDGSRTVNSDKSVWVSTVATDIGFAYISSGQSAGRYAISQEGDAVMRMWGDCFKYENNEYVRYNLVSDLQSGHKSIDKTGFTFDGFSQDYDMTLVLKDSSPLDTSTEFPFVLYAVGSIIYSHNDLISDSAGIFYKFDATEPWSAETAFGTADTVNLQDPLTQNSVYKHARGTIDLFEDEAGDFFTYGGVLAAIGFVYTNTNTGKSRVNYVARYQILPFASEAEHKGSVALHSRWTPEQISRIEALERVQP